MDHRVDAALAEAIGRVQRAAYHLGELIDAADKQLPPLEVLRGRPAARAIWQVELEQATLGRYYSELYRHVTAAVDGARRHVSHRELDRLYRNPRNTGDLRMIAKLLGVIADAATDSIRRPATGPRG
jgi:hypothetical protein